MAASKYKTADPELVAMGERIRVKREALGISQEELGFRVGTNKATIHLYETGEREMKWRRLRDIASCLHTTAEEPLVSLVVSAALFTSYKDGFNRNGGVLNVR